MLEFDRKGRYKPIRDKMGDPIVDPGVLISDEKLDLDFSLYPKHLAIGCDDPSIYYFDEKR
jgi:hypothetical protein